NGLVDRRPAIIARCTSTADVAAAVRFGRAEGLTISVYGGGHSVTGAAVHDDGLCIDLRGLTRLDVDPATRTLRAGGGGNFGIVTTFTLRLHPLGPLVWGGMLVFPGFRGAEVLRGYRDFLATAPDEVGSGLAFMTAPHEEFVPEPARGHPAVGIICCYAGAPGDGPVAYQPLLDLGPAMAMVQPMPYVAVQQLINAGNIKGRINYWTGDFYDACPDAAVDALVEIATQP